ncbi:benzoate/H(+) symporter BenE family transporter [Xanthobacter oligotrophicus]|uniref:benzoate/H(+) symporter BenE family transporter n=1 Tax=Xanthobacter oligotrophicus TaxID=2607286 RepID=UPI0011F3EB61|nr:benzoate/H(+) symporter BenE family transporter [Xanthobacter oligotrophicus]MCG5236477.1 benzoate/H(+) symporter BenE family transporter [Xanthobacter oligotrophicus]
MRVSIIVSAFVAALVGFGGTLAIVLAAAAAVGANPAETSSWVAAICLAIAATSAFLSIRYRMPIIAAWSTPGAALIAGFGSGIGMASATGAFLVAGLLVVLCAAIKPLGTLVARIPVAVAAAMLAGVLVRFVMALAEHAAASPALVLPVIAAFFIVRVLSPNWAVPAALVVGGAGAVLLGRVGPMPEFELSALVWTTPRFETPVLVGLGLPLFLVTMASQNLPGFAVLRACGYVPPVRPILAVTGLASMASAPFGAHASNLAAIAAALCTGPDTHPDPRQRWLAGPVYAGFYVLLAAAGASLVGVFAALPPALIATIAGLALLPALTGALTAALNEDKHRVAAVATFATTASGVTALGLGAPVWGLAAGLLIVGLDRLRRI